jgi:lysozyme
MKSAGLIILLVLCNDWSAVPAQAQQTELALTNDLSRGELLRLTNTNKALIRDFEFPKHIAQYHADWVFGIDVSHYDGNIDWTQIRKQGPAFVYIKATQGDHLFDDTFKKNWSEIAVLEPSANALYKGAYHFFSAEADPANQADFFIKKIAEVGGLKATDLPPCLDLEWDMIGPNGSDKWLKVPAAEIVNRVKIWLDRVEKGTGKRPIIYTNPSWWSAMLGKRPQFEDYVIWTSDYSYGDLKTDNPHVPSGNQVVFWQFTDRGRILFTSNGKTGMVDANTYMGDLGKFLDTFKLAKR